MAEKTPRASEYFEKRYKPNEKHFDLERIRNKNKNKLEKIIEELENVELNYSKDKRDALVKVNQMSLTEKEREQKLKEEFSIIESIIEMQKKNLKQQLRDEILKQAKMLLILDDNKDIYEYYNLIVKNPLNGKYAELENDIYREFFMTHPGIETIIISYSELNDHNNNNNNGGNGGNPYDNDALEFATKLVEKAEATRLEKDINAALEVVNKLDDSKEKDELLQRLANIKVFVDLTEFKELLKKLLNDVNNKKTLDELEVAKVRKLFQKVPKEDISKYWDDLTKVTDYFNDQKQEEAKENFDPSKVKKYSFADKLIEFGGFIAGKLLKSDKFNGYRLSKAEAKLSKATKESKKQKLESKVDKIVKQQQDSDILSGVTLYTRRNKINKLKPKLYKDEISNFEFNKFSKTLNKYSNQMRKGLSKRIEKNSENIKEDKQRILNMLDQYVELVSVSNDMAEDINSAQLFLEACKGKLTKTEYLSYFAKFYMIQHNYNEDKDFILYENQDCGIEDIKKYYDSDEYKNQTNKLFYVNM